jgi:Family of unknown function (DUF6092)
VASPLRGGEDEPMPSAWVLDEDDALEILAFLVTAARTQVDEAREYGPLRLLMAAHRLAEKIQSRVSPGTAGFLTETLLPMPLLAVPRDDPADYVEGLDRLCATLAEHLRSRYVDEPGPT